jgi:hypothetical protein
MKNLIKKLFGKPKKTVTLPQGVRLYRRRAIILGCFAIFSNNEKFIIKFENGVELIFKTIDDVDKQILEWTDEAKRLGKGFDEYMEMVAKRLELDEFINSQNFRFRELGYRFTHSFRKTIEGTIDITMYLIDKNGNKLIQGYSTIVNDVLENVFEVTIQKSDVSTAMYQFLNRIGFKKVIGLYNGSGSLSVNYIEFMKNFKVTNDKVKAAFSTPAGKALNKALDNNFFPKKVIIDDNNKKVIVEWIIK